jgi:hypothetical protein
MAVSKTKSARLPSSLSRARAGTGGEGTAALLIRVGGRSPKAKPMAITVRPRTMKAVASQPGPMTALIETYGDALEQSRRVGRSVRFMVDVEPRGEPRFTAITDHAVPAGDIAANATDPNDLEASLTAARTRGRHRVAEILSGDDMLSADEFAALIGTSRVTVNAKRQAHQVLGLEGAKRGFRFPAWQLDENGKPFAALPDLFDRLGDSPWAVYRFLVQHHPELDGLTGREALRRGRSDAAIATAESVTRAFS